MALSSIRFVAIMSFFAHCIQEGGTCTCRAVSYVFAIALGLSENFQGALANCSTSTFLKLNMNMHLLSSMVMCAYLMPITEHFSWHTYMYIHVHVYG